MYEREKAAMTASLAQAFPEHPFKVYATAGEGWSSASVKWMGGPTRAEVNTIMQPWERQFGPITLYRDDPKLLETYAHLHPKSDDPRESSHDLGAANVKRHLQHLFPTTAFDITDSLGPISNYTSVTARWDHTLEGAPTVEQCREALTIFKSTWPHYVDQVGMDFRRMFGGFNYVDLEHRPTPAFVANNAKPRAVSQAPESEEKAPLPTPGRGSIVSRLFRRTP